MKKLHAAMKVVIFSGVLASFPNSDAVSMEILPDSGMAKLIENAGIRLAEKIHKKTSYASNAKKPVSVTETPMAKPREPDDCHEKEHTERG